MTRDCREKVDDDEEAVGEVGEERKGCKGDVKVEEEEEEEE